MVSAFLHHDLRIAQPPLQQAVIGTYNVYAAFRISITVPSR
jgi:hypothetical protein